MSLPVQDTPTYSMVIPSTGKKYHFVPFRVKQQKAIMYAVEQKDNEAISESLRNLIKECFKEDINVDDLAYFDMMSIFNNLRAKSVGNLVDINVHCQNTECPQKDSLINVQIDILNYELRNFDKEKMNIPLWDDVGVIMRYPTLDVFMELNDVMSKVSKDENTELPESEISKFINWSIKAVYSGDSIQYREDFSEQELENFIDQLTPEQMEKIQNFFRVLPNFYMDIEYVCPICGHKNKLTIEGIQSFFE